MRHKGHLLATTLAAAAAGLAISSTSIAAPAGPVATGAVKCSAKFSATVRLGPDKGWSLHGTMTLNASKAGVLNGKVTPTHGQPSGYVGQVTGLGISIALYVPEKRGMIYGTGTLFTPVTVSSCAVGGGTFAGARAGDFGDWELAPTSPGCLPGAIKDSEGACIPAFIRYGFPPKLPISPN